MEATREQRALAAALDAMETARRRAAGASQLLVDVLTSPNEPEDDALEAISDLMYAAARGLEAACVDARAATRGGGAE